MRLVTLLASSAVLAACSASSGADLRGGLVAPVDELATIPAQRTIAYRADSFTDPGLDVSPDGRRLYFSAMGEIYVVPIEGGLAEPLPLGGGWKTRPVISPDGLSLAFLSDTGAGVAAWRSSLSGAGSAAGRIDPGYEATTLAWIDNASRGSTGGSTDGVSAIGLTVDYEGEHGSAHHSGRVQRLGHTPPASMSADHEGNVFLHRPTGIVRIDASTGIEEVVVAEGNDRIGQPRVMPDGTWLGFATTSGETAQLMLRNLASGELRTTGCRLDPWWVTGTASDAPEPSYAFIPGQQAVVLERGGRFHRCSFEGVETPIPVEADVRIDLAPRIRPSLVRANSAAGLPLNLTSTADGGLVAFSDAGHVWIHHRSTGQTSRISTSNLHEQTPALSADGRRLAYVERFQDQSSNLTVLDLETGASNVLLHSQGVLGNPAWSPDGRRLAFIETPVLRPQPSIEVPEPHGATLRWLGLDGSTGVLGPITVRGIEAFPTLTWDSSGSAIFYTKEQGGLTLMSHRLGGEPQPLLSADVRVWNLRVSPSRRFVALATRDGVYVTPILLSSGDHPTFSWSDIRSMKRLWTGGGDNLQWLADDSLVWTVQHKLIRALPGEEPREIADLSLPPEIAPEPKRRAYTGATVITMDQAGTIEDAVIVTNGRTLEYVGPRAGAPDLTGIETTSLSGKWVLPGFIDVHAHNPTEFSEYNLAVSQYNLANLSFGVTTVFDPGPASSFEPAVTWAISQRDEFIGPTAYGTATVVLGYPNTVRSIDVESYEHALTLASDIAGRGGLMVKNYRQGTRRQRQWLAGAARATGLGVTADEDRHPGVILPLIIDGYTAIEHTVSWEPLREDVKRFLIESRVSLTPTLVLEAEDLAQRHEPGLLDLRRDCLVDPRGVGINPSTAPREEDAWFNARKVILADYAELLNRGARVTIGAHGEAAGLDFHWELELLAMGGAAPMNILQAATMNGAEKLGLESRIGSLVEGKDADFIVLNANPLDDIRNARNIERVVRRGRVATWPTGPAPQSWRSATSWDDCQSWNFGLGRSEGPIPN